MEDDQKQVEDTIIFLENLLRNGEFATVDEYLSSVNLETLSSTSILGALTITFWGKDKLSKREQFLKRSEVILKKNLGETRAEKLLRWRR